MMHGKVSTGLGVRRALIPTIVPPAFGNERQCRCIILFCHRKSDVSGNPGGLHVHDFTYSVHITSLSPRRFQIIVSSLRAWPTRRHCRDFHRSTEARSEHGIRPLGIHCRLAIPASNSDRSFT